MYKEDTMSFLSQLVLSTPPKIRLLFCRIDLYVAISEQSLTIIWLGGFYYGVDHKNKHAHRTHQADHWRKTNNI